MSDDRETREQGTESGSDGEDAPTRPFERIEPDTDELDQEPAPPSAAGGMSVPSPAPGDLAPGASVGSYSTGAAGRVPESSPEAGSGSVTPAPYGGPAGVARPAPRPPRTSDQIRADIEAQREELSQSVDVLRDKVNELTDWRGQVRKHRREIVIGAAAVGFVVGARIMLGRRRR